MRKWERHLTRDANILSKYLIVKGIEKGPVFVLPKWPGIKNQFWSWRDGETGIHFLPRDLEYFSDFLVQYAIDNPRFPEKYRRRCKEICDNVVSRITLLSKRTNARLSISALSGLFVKFCEQYIRLGETIIMTQDELEREVAGKLSTPNLLPILTAPTELSFDGQEELDRLTILTEIERHHKEVFLKEDLNRIKEKLKHIPALYRKIQHHVRKYCWIPLNYEKELWDIDFFINLFKSYINEPFDWSARIQDLRSYSINTKKKKLELGVEIDRQMKSILGLLEARTFVRLYRANIFSLAFYSAFPLLDEVAKRVSLTRNVLKYYTPQEILRALAAREKLDIEKGMARKNNFVMLVEDNQYAQFEGSDAREVMRNEYSEEKVEKISFIKGVCAFPGKVQGKVKILFDAREMRKVESGDILVCEATNPDLIIAMGRAGAIVTNEGGITSHAAIVSREMKKPCVIATKTATKVLRDGDIVEVDADKGIVRIIKTEK